MARLWIVIGALLFVLSGSYWLWHALLRETWALGQKQRAIAVLRAEKHQVGGENLSPSNAAQRLADRLYGTDASLAVESVRLRGTISEQTIRALHRIAPLDWLELPTGLEHQQMAALEPVITQTRSLSVRMPNEFLTQLSLANAAESGRPEIVSLSPDALTPMEDDALDWLRRQPVGVWSLSYFQFQPHHMQHLVSQHVTELYFFYCKFSSPLRLDGLPSLRRLSLYLIPLRQGESLPQGFLDQLPGSSVQHLSLYDQLAKAEFLQVVAQSPTITHLTLYNHELRDDELEVLLKMRGLQRLELDSQQLSDDMVERLAHLPNLRRLIIPRCRHISHETIARIRTARPRMLVDH